MGNFNNTHVDVDINGVHRMETRTNNSVVKWFKGIRMFKPLLILAILILLSMPVLAVRECVVKEDRWFCVNSISTNKLARDECRTNADCESQATAKIYDNLMDVVNEKIEKIYKTTRNTISVFGTEYKAGEDGTIFLQLLDSNKQAINDASCYITVYYPDKSNLLSSALMSYLITSDGLYYYDLTIPSQLGVYMMSATCFLPADAWIDDFIDYTKIESYLNVSVSGSKISLLSQSELPDNQSNQSSTIDIDMSNNVLLMHFDNQSSYGENNTYFHDFSGAGNNGNCSSPNCPTYALGKIGDYGLNFDGSNDWIQYGNSSSLNQFDDGITVSLWYKPVYCPYTQWQIPLSKGSSGWGDWTIGTNKDDGWAIWVITNTTGHKNYNGYYGDDLYTEGDWVFIAGTYNGTTSTLYILNVSSGNLYSKERSFQGNLLNDPSTRLWSGTLAGDTFLTGVLDEVSVWNRSLTQEEIYTVYNLTNGLPATYGYVVSEPIVLLNTTWIDYLSVYNKQEGDINFEVWNQNNVTICSDLGDIGSCANSTTPIKLYAELSVPSVVNVTPEIDEWSVSWANEGFIIDEIRGSGELHVSANISVSCTYDNLTIPDINYTYFDVKFNQTFVNQQDIYSYLQTLNSTIYNWFDTTWTNQQTTYDYIQSLNQTMYNFHNQTTTTLTNIESILTDIYVWFEYQASVLS